MTAAFLCCLAAKIAKEGLKGTENGIDKSTENEVDKSIENGVGKGIKDGICEGIQKSRQLLEMGFGNTKAEPSYPISKLFESNSEQNTICDVAIPDFKNKASGKKNNWRILEECTRGMLESIAYNAVKNGTEDALRKVPNARLASCLLLMWKKLKALGVSKPHE